MKTRIIEATSTGGNHGKFLLGRMDTEWSVRTGIWEAAHLATDGVLGEGAYDRLIKGREEREPEARPLLRSIGWNPNQLWVLDLQTCEGAAFNAVKGGHASNDLNKHKIWVCPLFEPFLAWLYQQDLTDLDELPIHVLLEHPLQFAGYRRPGSDGDQ